MFSAVCVAGTLSKYFTQHTYFYPPKNSLNWATGISIFLTGKQKNRVISELREPSLSQWLSKDCTWVSDFQTDTTLCLNGHTDKAGYMRLLTLTQAKQQAVSPKQAIGAVPPFKGLVPRREAIR